jgi:hypothetical protein
MEALVVGTGTLVVLVILIDIFQTIVLPRPIVRSRVGVARVLVYVTWRGWRRYCSTVNEANVRERRLGLYAPSIVILLLVVWIGLLIVGYGTIFYGLRDQIQPHPRDLLEAFYFAGTSLLTIGFGDIVAIAGPARVIALIAGATGLVLVALVITFVFSLYAFFQRRELLVTTLDERAGAPPSGVTLLETHGRLGMVDDLARIFAAWELWCAEVLDSHLAYPLLGFFRSSHDNESWVSALGALLDAATLCVTTVEGAPLGPAKILRGIGAHLVEDVTSYFELRHEHDVEVERSEFEEARARLAAAGYRLREVEAAWKSFSATRATYASDLNAMARYWAVPPAQWIGDRSTLRHPSA